MSAQNKRLYGVFLILVLIILGAVAPLYLQLDSLRADISKLNEALTTRTAEFENAIAELKDAYKSLESKYSELAAEIAKLPETLRYPLTVTDGLGRSVTITSKPSRVVSCAPSITEILFAIGAGDLVVGVDKYSDYPPDVVKLKEEGKIAVVGGYSNPDVEAIIALQPDVVFMTTGVQTPYAYRLAELGVTVIVLKEESVADVFDAIMLVGRITGNLDGALSVITEMKNKIAYVHNTVEEYIRKANITRVKVLQVGWLEPIWTAGSKTFIDHMISLAGGENVFADLEGYKVVSPETVVERAPDIIVGGTMGEAQQAQEMYNKIMGMEGWGVIPAVANGRVCVLAGRAQDLLFRPGPGVADGVALLAIIFYPEAFGLSVDDVPHIIVDPADVLNLVPALTG